MKKYEKKSNEISQEDFDKNIDIKNILNLDKAQYNNLLVVLVQDKNFMKEFLVRAQMSLLGQKTKRDKRTEEISCMFVMPIL